LKNDDKIDEEMKSEKVKEAFSFIITNAYLGYRKNGKKTCQMPLLVVRQNGLERSRKYNSK
jgi:hypothetical protein